LGDRKGRTVLLQSDVGIHLVAEPYEIAVVDPLLLQNSIVVITFVPKKAK
jgi:hypothetical protein